MHSRWDQTFSLSISMIFMIPCFEGQKWQLTEVTPSSLLSKYSHLSQNHSSGTMVAKFPPQCVWWMLLRHMVHLTSLSVGDSDLNSKSVVEQHTSQRSLSSTTSSKGWNLLGLSNQWGVDSNITIIMKPFPVPNKQIQDPQPVRESEVFLGVPFLRRSSHKPVPSHVRFVQGPTTYIYSPLPITSKLTTFSPEPSLVLNQGSQIRYRQPAVSRSTQRRNRIFSQSPIQQQTPQRRIYVESKPYLSQIKDTQRPSHRGSKIESVQEQMRMLEDQQLSDRNESFNMYNTEAQIKESLEGVTLKPIPIGDNKSTQSYAQPSNRKEIEDLDFGDMMSVQLNPKKLDIIENIDKFSVGEDAGESNTQKDSHLQRLVEEGIATDNPFNHSEDESMFPSSFPSEYVPEYMPSTPQFVENASFPDNYSPKSSHFHQILLSLAVAFLLFQLIR